MKVAIVHYHLGPGGVSKVIIAASRALTEAGISNVILVGEVPDDIASDLPIRWVPGLAYTCGGHESQTETLLESMRTAAADALGAAPDVWHFHNHSLGKNIRVSRVVARLAEENECLVLQIHDLAEDGRPLNYQLIAGEETLYPVSPRVHYAFLNRRDLGMFVDAGLPESCAEVVVNPIVGSGVWLRNEFRAPVVFAPVRGIRRKNLGELVFLSALAPQGTRFAISRAPLDPSALPIHDTWKRFAESQRLPIGFDVVDRVAPVAGADSGFESWVKHSTHWASTSVAEGFGLPFLEAIAHGKPLIGRNLPHITAQHLRHGIRTGDLYDQILIPLEWVDLAILKDHLNTTLERNYRAYGRPLTREICEATMDALTHDGWLDFGNLSEPLQQGAIERIGEPGCRRVPRVNIGGEIQPAFSWLEAALSNTSPLAPPDQLAPYSPQVLADSLRDIYGKLIASASGTLRFLSTERILSLFLTPDSFHFLLSALKPTNSALPYRAVIFDIYGTLLIAPAGGVKPDPAADPELRRIIREFGHSPPASPSTAIHAAVRRHHAAAGVQFPEVDLRVMWREVLSLDPGTSTQELVEAIEAYWHPAEIMPGAENVIGHLAATGISLGVLSNAQCNTLASLGGITDFLAPELVLLSYQHGVAKPASELFQTLADRLAGRGITPEETLYIGNDPIQDIIPAAAHGFKTALFSGHPESLREGSCQPDFEITHWTDLILSESPDMRRI